MALYFTYVAVLAAGVLGIYRFSGIWYQVGLGAAIAIVGGRFSSSRGATDRNDKAARAGLDRI